MLENMLHALGFLIQTVPAVVLAYIPFYKSELRISKRDTITTLMILLCVLTIGFAYITNVPEGKMWGNVYYIAALFLFYVLSFFYIRTGGLKRNIVYILTICFSIMVYTTENFLLRFLNQYDRADVYTLQDVILYAVITAVVFPIQYYFMKKIRNAKDSLEDSPIQRQIRYITFFLAVVYMLLISMIATKDLQNPWIFMLFLLLNICTYLILTLLLSTSEMFEATVRQNSESQLIKEQLRMRTIQFRQLYENMEQVRHANHNMRHHFTMIEGYLEKGNVDKSLDYVRTYIENIPRQEVAHICDNYTVDIMVGHYERLAKENALQFQTKMDVPEILAVEDMDLCTIIGNLLDNALYACLSMDKSQPRDILFSIQLLNHNLLIHMENSYDGKIKMAKDGKKFLTTKPTGNGIGLESVRILAEKYNGAVKYEYKADKKRFYSSVRLEIE